MDEHQLEITKKKAVKVHHFDREPIISEMFHLIFNRSSRVFLVNDNDSTPGENFFFLVNREMI